MRLKHFAGTVRRQGMARRPRWPRSGSMQCRRRSWNDRTFDVLHTASKAERAIAEMYFHLARGQPVFPSKAQDPAFRTDCHAVFVPAIHGPGGPRRARPAHGDVRPDVLRRTCTGIPPHPGDSGGCPIHRPGSPDRARGARSEWPNIVVFCDPAGPGAPGGCQGPRADRPGRPQDDPERHLIPPARRRNSPAAAHAAYAAVDAHLLETPIRRGPVSPAGGPGSNRVTSSAAVLEFRPCMSV